MLQSTLPRCCLMSSGDPPDCLQEETMRVRRPSVVQSANEDGTVKLAVPNPRKYYHEIAYEISKTYRGYSDVTIVCRDGASFDANRSVLSRCLRLSHYLQAHNTSDEKTWLIMPEVESNKMKKALQWFYDVSSRQRSDDEDPSLADFNEVFGDAGPLGPTTAAIDLPLSDSEGGTETTDVEGDEELWDIFCRKDALTETYFCPLCNNQFENPEDVQQHLGTHNLSVRQSEGTQVHDTTLEEGFCQESELPSSSHESNFLLQSLMENHVAFSSDQILEMVANDNEETVCRENIPEEPEVKPHAIYGEDLPSASAYTGKSFLRDKSIKLESSSQSDPEERILKPMYLAYSRLAKDVINNMEKFQKSQLNLLQLWSPGMKMNAQKSEIYIFRGSFLDFQAVVEADNYLWTQSGKRDNSRSKRVYIYYTQENSHNTSDDSDPRQPPHEKRILFLRKTQTYIVHYFEGKSAESDAKNQEAIHSANDCEARKSIEVPSTTVLKPHATDEHLSISFLREVAQLGVTECQKFPVWENGTHLDAKSGNIYLIRGCAAQFQQVVAGDCYQWTKCGKNLRSGKNLKFYFVAKPDISRPSDKRRYHLLSSKNPGRKWIDFRKKVYFYTKSSLYLVFYYGNDSQIPWTRQVIGNANNEEEDLPGHQDDRIIHPKRLSLRGSDFEESNKKADESIKTLKRAGAALEDARRGNLAARKLESGSRALEDTNSTTRIESFGSREDFAPPKDHNDSRGRATFNVDNSGFSERVEDEFHISGDEDVVSSSPSKKLKLDVDPDSLKARTCGTLEETVVEASSSDSESSSEVLYSTGDDSDASVPSVPSVLSIRPYAVAQTEFGAEWVKHLVTKVDEKVIDPEPWTSETYMEPKAGNVYVLRGSVKDFPRISASDALIWRIRKSTKSQSKKTVCYIEKFLSQEEKLFAKKKITFVRQISTFLVFYYSKTGQRVDSGDFEATALNSCVATPTEGRLEVEGPAVTFSRPDREQRENAGTVEESLSVTPALSDSETLFPVAKNPPLLPNVVTDRCENLNEQDRSRLETLDGQSLAHKGAVAAASKASPSHGVEDTLLKPYAVQQALLYKPLLRQFKNRISVKGKYPTWSPELTMDPREGHLYIVHGRENDFESITSSDSLQWSKRKVREKTDKVIYYLDAKSHPGDAETGHDRSNGDVLTKKRVIFLHKINLYVVFYNWHQIPRTWTFLRSLPDEDQAEVDGDGEDPKARQRLVGHKEATSLPMGSE